MRIPVLLLFGFAAVIVAITGNWPWISSVVFPNTTWGYYSRSFFENVLVEAHGTLIDIFVISVVLYFFEQRRALQDRIQREKRTLADLRFYRGTDASFRVYSAVRNLLELGVRDLQLSEANLANLSIDGLRLTNCSLYAVNFVNSKLNACEFIDCVCEAGIFAGSTLRQVTFTRVNLCRAKFQGAKLRGCDFSSSDIRSADFTGADLRSAIFRGVDCENVNFKNADLRSANFVGAKNLTGEMLAAAADAQYVKGLAKKEVVTAGESNHPA